MTYILDIVIYKLVDYSIHIYNAFTIEIMI